MTAPGWILDIAAALMLVVAAVSAARLIVDRPWRRDAVDADIDAAHLLMGIAMAGMLAGRLSTLPDGAWVVVFGVLTAWFAWCVGREWRGRGVRVLADSHHAPHLVHGAAMLYMFTAFMARPAAGPGMSGMGSAAASPVLSTPAAFLFAIVLAGYVIVDLDRRPGLTGHGRALAIPAVAPAGAAGAAPAAAAGGGAACGAAASATAAPAGAPVAGGCPAPVLASAVPHGTGSRLSTLPERVAGRGGTATGGNTDTGSAGGARSAGVTGPAARRVLLEPRTAVACRVAMGVTMAFMLIIMI